MNGHVDLSDAHSDFSTVDSPGPVSLLFIYDVAVGIPPSLWDAGKAMVGGERWLAVSSPCGETEK